MGKAMGAPQEEGLTILHGGTNGPSASLLHPGSFKSRLAGSWVPCFLFLPFSLLPSPTLCLTSAPPLPIWHPPASLPLLIPPPLPLFYSACSFLSPAVCVHPRLCLGWGLSVGLSLTWEPGFMSVTISPALTFLSSSNWPCLCGQGYRRGTVWMWRGWVPFCLAP